MRVGENATRTRTDSAAAGIRAPGAHPAGGRGRPVAAGVTIGALCALGATLSAHAAGPGSLTAPRAAARDVIAAPSPAELTGQIVAVAPNALVIQSLGGPDGRQAGVKQTMSARLVNGQVTARDVVTSPSGTTTTIFSPGKAIV